MGQGIDLARPDAPEHAAVMDNFKDQLVIALVKRFGPTVIIPVDEVDATGDSVLYMSVVDRVFKLEVRKKQ